MYIPIGFFYGILPAMQYYVGQDYGSYIDIYMSEDYDVFFNNGEFIFYALFEILNNFKLNEQFVFIFTSLLQSILFFLVLDKFYLNKIRLWLFILLYFTTTGLYFNQMNGLRQSLAILITPLMFYSLINRSYYKTFIYFVLGIFSHASFIIVVPFIFVCNFLRNISGKKIIPILFLTSPIIYLVIFPYISELAILTFFPGYSGYLNSGIIFSLKSTITKIYYVPIFLLFIYYYMKGFILIKTEFERLSLVLFSLTYSLWITDLSLPLYGRILMYFIFFYTMPIYYICDFYIKNKMNLRLIIILFYILMPFFYKISIGQEGEYIYRHIPL